MILSTKPLPVTSAGSFNFSFEIGAGVEYYRTANTSVRLEFQVQHYSNAYTAGSNPGVDSGMIKVTYSFGR
jgi:opacity protein-like surface antigen